MTLFEQYSIRTTGIYASAFKLDLLQLHSTDPSYPAVFIYGVVGVLIVWFGSVLIVWFWFVLMGRAGKEENFATSVQDTTWRSLQDTRNENIFLWSLGVKAELKAI